MDLDTTIGNIKPVDQAAVAQAVERQQLLTKPAGSLGRLEDVAARVAGIVGTERPTIRNAAVIVAAADHGVTRQRVTGYPSDVTAQMVLNFLAGGAAISVMCRELGVRQVIVDAGVAADLPEHPDLRSVKVERGTADISVGPAMTRGQARQCLEAGISLAAELVADGVDLIATGEMGIGNTTASAAITAAVTGLPPEQATGEGTGRTPAELRSKIEVVRTALEVNDPDPSDGIDVLSKVGGFEIGVLAGVVLGTAAHRRVVVLDGFISTAAALVACTLCPHASEYMVSSHVSAERGHRSALAHLNQVPLLDLEMRLGEGTGAVLAIPIIRCAAATLSEMATFAEAGVSEGELTV